MVKILQYNCPTGLSNLGFSRFEPNEHSNNKKGSIIFAEAELSRLVNDDWSIVSSSTACPKDGELHLTVILQKE